MTAAGTGIRAISPDCGPGACEFQDGSLGVSSAPADPLLAGRAAAHAALGRTVYAGPSMGLAVPVSPPPAPVGLAVAATRWIRVFHPSAASQMRLYCFPGAHEAASRFIPMSAALAPGIEVRALQYPGRQDRRLEPRLENIRDLTDFICGAMTRPAGYPYAFFGHGLGALVAYETARRLRLTGAGPRWLFVSGCRAPSTYPPDSDSPRGSSAAPGTGNHRWGSGTLAATPAPPARGHDRPLETTYRWVSGEPLNCPVTALVGDGDPEVTTAQAAAWRGHTIGPFGLRVIPGGRGFLDARHHEVFPIVSSALGLAPGNVS